MTGRIIGSLVLASIFVAQWAFGCSVKPVHGQALRPVITIVPGCRIHEEGTHNNQGAITYFTCDNSVAFIIKTGSVYEQHLRQLIGKTVDVKVEVLE